MSAGEATWPATSIPLIGGERDAILIYAVVTPTGAGRLAEWDLGNREEPDDDLNHARPCGSLLGLSAILGVAQPRKNGRPPS